MPIQFMLGQDWKHGTLRVCNEFLKEPDALKLLGFPGFHLLRSDYPPSKGSGMVDNVPDCLECARRYSRMLVHQALFDEGNRLLSEGRHDGQIDSDEAKTDRVAFQLLKLGLL